MDQNDLFIIKQHVREHQKVINEQLKAQQYYDNEAVQDGKGINHDFFALQVEEKVNYLVGKEPTVTCDTNEQYLEAFKKSMGKSLLATMQELSRECSIKAIAWLQAYIDEDKLKFKVIPSEEIIPIWEDNTHKVLQKVVRKYPIEVYNGTGKETIWKIEIYDEEHIYYYEEVSGEWQIDAEKYLSVQDGQEISHFYTSDGQGYGFSKVPFCYLKNNAREKSDLKPIKDLIDAYNSNRGRMDSILEDFKNWLAVIKNYVGDTENENVFSEMLEKRRVFVDENGGVDILTPNIDTQANESHNQTLKDDIILFGQSVDRNKMVNGSAASGIALKFLFAGLDLKCNNLEVQMNSFFDQIEYFVKGYLNFKGVNVSDQDDIEVVFNRDVSINEADAIAMCKDSVGVIDKQTIIENHPWVKDADEVMKRLESENKSSLEYAKKIVGGEDNG